MKIQVNKTFLKELNKIPINDRRKAVKLLFDEVENYAELTQIPNLVSLRGILDIPKSELVIIVLA